MPKKDSRKVLAFLTYNGDDQLIITSCPTHFDDMAMIEIQVSDTAYSIILC